VRREIWEEIEQEEIKLASGTLALYSAFTQLIMVKTQAKTQGPSNSNFALATLC
jgi:hypothetical protein